MPAFGPLCTRFHDACTPRASPAEIAWYAARLPRDAGPSLELMCGSGRLLLPLVEGGIALHGVDASAAMLASGEARLDAAGLRAPLFRQDVAAMNLPFRYAAAFVAAEAFQRIADPVAAMQALTRIRAHLVDPGLLLLDLAVPALAAHPPGAAVVEIETVGLDDGTRIARRSEIIVNVDARRLDIVSRYEQRRRAAILAREDERIALTWHTEDELVAMLREAGFRDVRIEPAARPVDGETPEGERRFAVSAKA